MYNGLLCCQKLLLKEMYSDVTQIKAPLPIWQAARIIAKLAAWGRDLMEGSDLNYYFNWIKSQLSSQVRSFIRVCRSVFIIHLAHCYSSR